MTPQEYIRRRQKLTAKMAARSAALIFSAPQSTHGVDNHYHYRQNNNFWYFTGFNEPQALLILIKQNEDHSYSLLFNRMRNKAVEIWTGRCLGQEAAPKLLSVSKALPWDDINNQLYILINGLDVIYHAHGEYDFADKLVFSAMDKLQHVAHRQSQAPAILADWRPWVNEMRLIKSEEELTIIRRACQINAMAHTRAMQKCKPGLYEYQLEGEIQYEFNNHGIRCLSYSTIVGSGENSCVLHYTENSSRMQGGDLVLIDAGCKYQGYASDITRTFPINGRFLPKQRAIYDLVLTMLNCALKLYGPGRSIQEVNEEVVLIMVTGLVKLGIMKGDIETLIAAKAHRQFFMHHLSHWLGLDVHDVGDYGSSERNRILEPGMVLTIEPGIYIASDAEVPALYRNIGIRIEDNIVITDTGNENLTDSVAKNPDAIETIMAETIQK